MEQAGNKDHNREVAYFRFALIAPVIQENFPDVTAAAFLRRVCAKPIIKPDGTAFKYNPGTLRKWVDRYRVGGMDALMPQNRSDKGTVKTLSDECILEIYRIKEKFPKLSAVQIRARLIEDGYLPAVVSPRSIQRFIKDNGLKTAAGSGIMKDRKAYEEPFFGATWQADTCYFPFIPDDDGKRRRTYLIAAVDDHSRMIVGARLFFEDNSFNFQKVLKDAVATYGIPNKLYVDHGPSYENSQISYICGSIGTILIHAPIRDGAAKGKCERMFGVLKSRWLNGVDTNQIRSIDEFNRELTEAVRKHNITVNSSTGQTPVERFLAANGRIRIPESKEWLDENFMNRVRRKVKGDSTLSIQNAQFDAPMQFIRRTVEVRFLPDKFSDAYIFCDGIRYPLKLTDKQANSRVKRDNPITVDYSKNLEGGV